jgi:hypothetical protein
MADHDRAIRHELSVMSGLYQLALLLPDRAVAREQPCPAKGPNACLINRALWNFSGLDEDPPGKSG